MELHTLISTCIREVKTLLNLPSLVLLGVTLLLVYVTHLVYRWMNPRSDGRRLPPGSMGLPLIGETIQLIIPSASLDMPPFIQKRFKRYGPIFRTKIAGRPVIITADPEFNQFLLRQDNKLIESWSLDTFAKVFDQANLRQHLRKYTKNLTLHHFGAEALRSGLIPQIEVLTRETLSTWSNHESFEVKSEAISMAIDFAKRQIFSQDLEDGALKISDMYKSLVKGFISLPINLPGTAHHKTLQMHKKLMEVMRGAVVKRLAESERRHGDLLDHIIDDMKTESFLNEDFIVQFMFGLLFVASDSVSTTIALAFKLIAEHPLVLEELTAEHEAIIRKRENRKSGITWDEYKSMSFTHQVINEVLRLGNVAPGLFRRALTDIQFKGYTIPSGWVILIATAGLHLNENQFEDPLKFNPWRWKGVQPSQVVNCYMPFGWGVKQCAGAEYARVLMSTFLHVLVTEYRWTLVKGGKIVRMPMLRFPDGFHYKLFQRTN